MASIETTEDDTPAERVLQNVRQAEFALEAHGAAPDAGRGDPEEAIPDLMVDLLHLARARGLDPAAVVEQVLADFAMEEDEVSTSASPTV